MPKDEPLRTKLERQQNARIIELWGKIGALERENADLREFLRGVAGQLTERAKDAQR